MYTDSGDNNKEESDESDENDNDDLEEEQQPEHKTDERLTLLNARIKRKKRTRLKSSKAPYPFPTTNTFNVLNDQQLITTLQQSHTPSDKFITTTTTLKYTVDNKREKMIINDQYDTWQQFIESIPIGYGKKIINFVYNNKYYPSKMVSTKIKKWSEENTCHHVLFCAKDSKTTSTYLSGLNIPTFVVGTQDQNIYFVLKNGKIEEHQIDDDDDIIKLLINSYKKYPNSIKQNIEYIQVID